MDRRSTAEPQPSNPNTALGIWHSPRLYLTLAAFYLVGMAITFIILIDSRFRNLTVSGDFFLAGGAIGMYLYPTVYLVLTAFAARSLLRKEIKSIRYPLGVIVLTIIALALMAGFWELAHVSIVLILLVTTTIIAFLSYKGWKQYSAKNA